MVIMVIMIIGLFPSLVDEWILVCLVNNCNEDGQVLAIMMNNFIPTQNDDRLHGTTSYPPTTYQIEHSRSITSNMRLLRDEHTRWHGQETYTHTHILPQQWSTHRGLCDRIGHWHTNSYACLSIFKLNYTDADGTCAKWIIDNWCQQRA